MVMGSNYQGEINGCYKSRNRDENEHPSYKNQYSKILYWQPKDGGQWVICDKVGTGFRAFAGSDAMIPVNIPPGEWQVSNDAQWIKEALLLQRV